MLARLNEGDLVVLRPVCHSSFLAALYSCLRGTGGTDNSEEAESSLIAGMVLGKILNCIRAIMQTRRFTIPYLLATFPMTSV